MPTSPPSRCTDPECNTLTTEGRCDEHQRKAWVNRSKSWGKGSTRKWREFRDARLKAEPRCRRCGTDVDVQVDHITPLSDGGAKWDPANCQTLCETCHEAKSLEEQRRRRRPGSLTH